jgi:hypothetical protein
MQSGLQGQHLQPNSNAPSTGLQVMQPGKLQKLLPAIFSPQSQQTSSMHAELLPASSHDAHGHCPAACKQSCAAYSIAAQHPSKRTELKHTTIPITPNADALSIQIRQSSLQSMLSLRSILLKYKPAAAATTHHSQQQALPTAICKRKHITEVHKIQIIIIPRHVLQ